MTKNHASALAFLLLAAIDCQQVIPAQPVDAFLLQLAKEQCDWEFRCCSRTEIALREKARFVDAQGCVAFRLLDLKDRLWIERTQVAAGIMTLDDRLAAACVAAAQARQCNARNGAPVMEVMDLPACAHVLVGRVAAGGECRSAEECAAGTRCAGDVKEARGVCEPLQKSGEICNRSEECDQSVRSTFCSPVEYHCRPRAAVGEACALGGGHGPPLIECDLNAGMSYCDPSSLRCQRYPQAGMPCLALGSPGIVAACDPDPGLALSCDPKRHVCTPPARRGESCDGVPCAAGYYCDIAQDRICQELLSDDEVCDSSSQCASHDCSFGPHGNGRSCQPSQQPACSGP